MGNNLAYYSAAAEVIPVILIGLAFESKYLTSRRTYDGSSDDDSDDGKYVVSAWSIAAIWIACLLVVGEWAALDVLRDGRVESYKQGLVGTSLAGGALALIAPLVAWQLDQIKGHWKDELLVRLLLLACLAGFTWQTVLYFD